MPRIEYAQPSDSLARQLGERRGGQLTPLDLLLAHNEGLARGWDQLLGAVRGQFRLSGELRELAILRIGRLNSADYEWDSHLPVARRAGLSEEVIAALQRDEPSTGHQPHDAVLELVDEMTREISVSEATFDRLRRHFDEGEIAELVATIAAYNMVSRFLVALDVQTADRAALKSAGAPRA